MKLKNFFKQGAIIAPLAGLLMAAPLTQAAETASAASINDAFTNGTVKVQFRYRYENVEQDNALETANASTMKSRISFQTQEFRDFTAFVEVDDVSNIGSDNHNSLQNGMADHSVVADPEGTEINQAWLQYSGIADTKIRYGRQRINLDNQRFVGGVGWRQNEQTYDALSITNTSLADTKVTYFYADNVNKILDDVDWDSNIQAFNVNYSGFALGKLSVYAYLIDFDDHATLSTETYGARFSGKYKLDDNIKLLYTAEYATQKDYEENPRNYTNDYWFLEAGAVISGVTVKVGQETLEGDLDKGVAFTTPLATLHKFQGWADQFLSTPAGGIEDLQFTLQTKAFGLSWTAVYHDFEAEDGSDNYGEELDIAIAKKLTKNVKALVKYANYNADDRGVDTEKLWFMLQVNF